MADDQLGPVDEVIEAIATARKVYRHPDWVSWADRWLSGQDRGTESAWEACQLTEPNPDFGSRLRLEAFAALAARCATMAALSYALENPSRGISAPDIRDLRRHAVRLAIHVLAQLN
jgi:hypothetical protein